MGKKLKLGKSRKDKFYHLAKETGKIPSQNISLQLVQVLQTSFSTYRRCRFCLLCLVPLAWYCHLSPFQTVLSTVIAVLRQVVRLALIERVTAMGYEITGYVLKNLLHKTASLQLLSVQLPPVIPDYPLSYVSQLPTPAHLTLMALKLACDFLTKGGWFITKVFRSKDYQPLVWIFQQFFKKVQATKPQASRNESAEIFVVCQGKWRFIFWGAGNPLKFQPLYIYIYIISVCFSVIKTPKRKKKKAEGYAEGDYTLFHRFTVMDFIKAENPVDFLNKANEITFENKEFENHPATTSEIRECCKDIKVLGRKELRFLLNWRRNLRRFLAKKLKEQVKELDTQISLSSEEEEESSEEESGKPKKDSAAKDEKEEEEEEEELEQKLAELKADEVAELKRKKKKILKERRKLRERAELKMDLPGVSIADEGETGMFSLKSISQTKLLNEITKGDMKSADAILADAEGGDDIYLSDADDGGEDNVSLASDLDPVDLQDVRQREAARKTGAQKKKVKFSPHEGASEEEEGENPLLVQLEDKTTRQERQTDLWFAKDVFASVDLDADEDLEIRQATKLYAQRGGVITGEGQKGLKQKGKLSPTAIQEEEVAGAERKQEAGNDNDDDDTEDSSSDDDENHIQALKQQMGKHGGIPAADDENDDFEVVPVERTVKHAQILDPEGLALGTIIATSKKRKRDLIDNSFNRYGPCSHGLFGRS
uniref:FtsJ RNA 2'-O-methyltransferase 3 n=1 Tax=Latimeria chalumnae TaxID=7897 RepID=H3A9A6_LATCH